MNKIFKFLILLFFITSCRKQHNIVNEDAGKNVIEFLRADFKKQTGYHDIDSNFVNSNFKSVIDWKTYRQISEDTIYVKVSVLNRVEALLDSSKIDIKDNVWIKAVRSDQKWFYKVLTFIKGDKQKPYSGAIASQSLMDRETIISFFLYDEILGRDSKGNKLKAGFPPMRIPNCIPGYVDGTLNTVVCSGSGGDDPGSYEDWLSGSPGDYHNVNPGGSAGGGGTNNNTVANFNNRIDDTKLPDCMKGVVDALKKLNGNSVADIINKFAGTVPGYNIKFIMEEGEDPLQVAGTKPKMVNGEMIIGFNSNRLTIQNATDLAVATSVLHESIHAYLSAFYTNDKDAAKLTYPQLFEKYSKAKALSNPIQHEEIAKNFIKDLSLSLKDYGKLKGYKFDDQVYDDMAWKGLLETDTFKNLPLIDRNRITDRIMAEQYGTKEKEVAQKGTRLGC
ncbi:MULTISPECIES: hypothetical protein [unclassified Sphingobacterium]|uniref:hypothetical protein n=1 Tax=unclassified Sphingobacterium TaxID=2609468 RepID=UPI0025D5F7DE|nr:MULTISPECIES: hypothetical protein [unclassified Sphingobacterium]